MIRIAERPYQLFFITALLLILLSLFTNSGSLNISPGSASSIIDGIFVLRAVAMFMLLSWLLYWITSKLLFSKVLIWLHVIATLIIVVFLSILIFKNGSSQRYLQNQYLKSESVSITEWMHFIIPLCIILLFAAQLLFFINLLLGVLRRVN